MAGTRPIPWISALLALISAIVMIVSGAEWWLALAVVAVWIGSLWLVTGAPPERATAAEPNPFSSANMGELVEYSGTPILITESGKISAANRAARKLLGSHIVGQDMRVGLRHPKAIKLLESNKSGFAQVRGLSRRRDVWRLNKQTLSNGLSVIELLNQTNEEDIGRAHTDFVANASHELRTPLASIIGYVETIRDGGDNLPHDKKEKFLDTILSEGRRLQNLVSDLMSLSRIEAEKHEQPQDAVPFAELVERASREAAGLGNADRLRLDLTSNLNVAGDTRQLEQLVRNLVDNAFKYGAHDKPVCVSLQANKNDEAELIVADEGDGIAEEHIPHLTRRFYRTDPSRSRASGGTGLGLAIVKHIVERHRGRLDITSQIGRGTTITVRVPMLDMDE
ncbi:MAG: ATP-binding protein [Pontixanthobacter sp.]